MGEKGAKSEAGTQLFDCPKDFQELPIRTDASGKKYLEINFNVRDLAGNTTAISL